MSLKNRDSLRHVQIYGERVQNKEKKKRMYRGWILLLILLAGIFGSGGFYVWQMSRQVASQQDLIDQLQITVRELETEKVLLDQALKEKEQVLEDIRNGILSSNGKTELRAYLTFDDGPCENTNKVMDILDDYDIKGTFFVTGSETAHASRIYNRILKDGHVLANHTYSHDYKAIYQSWDSFYQDVQKLEKRVFECTGQEMKKILRFPGGSNNGQSSVLGEIKKNLQKLGYTYFDWNVSGEDAIRTNITADEIVDNVIKYTDGKATAIILLHTTAKTGATVEALPEIIEYLIEEGYSFHTLDEADAPTGIVFHN